MPRFRHERERYFQVFWPNIRMQNQESRTRLTSSKSYLTLTEDCTFQYAMIRRVLICPYTNERGATTARVILVHAFASDSGQQNQNHASCALLEVKQDHSLSYTLVTWRADVFCERGSSSHVRCFFRENMNFIAKPTFRKLL